MTGKKYLLLFLFTICVIFNTFSWGQEIDTVIIEKETVIIQKQVEVEAVEYDVIRLGLCAKLYYTPGYAFNKYSFSNDLAPEYTKDFSCSQQYNLSHGIGFDLGLSVKHSVFQVGLRYNYTSADLHFWEYTTRNETIIENSGGGSTTSTIEVEGDARETYKTNRYYSLHIPITFGYSFSNQKSKIIINLGLDYNILLSYSGVTKDYPRVETIDLTDEVLYKNMTGAILAVEYSYTLNDRISILAEPYTIYYFSDFYTDGNISYKYYPVGLKAGIKLNY